MSKDLLFRLYIKYLLKSTYLKITYKLNRIFHKMIIKNKNGYVIAVKKSVIV
jgi:hypothetical protein